MFDFEKEEKELEKSRNTLQDLSISDDIANQAILEGMKRAKAMKMRKKKFLPIKVFLAASLFIISLITSVKVSDTMADYISNVPGIEKIVEFIRQDKGLLAAAENNYFQKIGTTVENGEVKVTIDSIVRDEKELLIFFNYRAKGVVDQIFPEEISLLDGNRNILPYRAYYSNLNPNGEKKYVNKATARVPLADGDILPEELILSFAFSVNDKMLNQNIDIPLTLDEDKFAAKKVINMNKSIKVEGQEITIKKVTIYPTQTAIDIMLNPENSKKIFGFNDIHLEDETGEKWEEIEPNDFISYENEMVIYLQSNYFSDPKELYLAFSSIRAVDKDELWVEIDPHKKKIIKAPKDGKISSVYKRWEELAITLETNPNFFDKQIFTYAEDLNGNIIGKGKSFGGGGSPNNNYVTYYVPYPTKEAVAGPIKLKLLDYPATINKKIKLKIK
ncbi:DUF4179 domain-containing protein [Cytobacillus dafuensis]|uniref:DUF4179 domain-containing protein n=1 Tax=Cytobacillus dafuensis TaxID=1742359 RepID=A0A5B8Z1F0_CYTDA|nr:DUF4179 domain-containing protein [Cytobacillus dafuensis]QED46641.1 DUF4179 domain-containing protein [Cytobacillus dafuensis]